MHEFDEHPAPELGSQFTEKRGGTERKLFDNPFCQAQGARFLIGFLASTGNMPSDVGIAKEFGFEYDEALVDAMNIVLERYCERYPEFIKPDDPENSEMGAYRRDVLLHRMIETILKKQIP